MSEVQTFRAGTMQEALDLVRRELGPDAVILHTREISHRRFLPFRKPKREVEITASLETNVSAKSMTPRTAPVGRSGMANGNRSRTSGGSTATALRPASGTSIRTPASNGSGKSSSGSRLDVSSEPSQTLAELLRSHGKPDVAPPEKPRSGAPPRISTNNTSAENPSDISDRPRFSSKIGRRRAALDRSAGPRAFEARLAQQQVNSAEHAARFAAKLDAIHKMIESLGRSGQLGHVEEIPPELFQLFTELIDAEVEENLARELVLRLKKHCTPQQLADPFAAKALLTGMVQSEIACCEPITTRRGRTKVVALVGSTGVGKTTTIAKLAANFRLRDGIRMGLITVDTYRVAAVEQLRTYAEIIDLPIKVVTNPQEMRRALDELAGLDLILIDTAGRSPCDDLQVQELKTLLAEADVHEVHLVLSLTSSPRHLEATAKKFADANATAVILTKLDETTGLGSLLSIARRIPLPISYITTGQGVPDDIEPARPDRLARLMLGLDQLGT